MGDMGEVFRAMDQYTSERRSERHAKAKDRQAEVEEMVDTLTVDNSGTWNIKKGDCKIQYYPTKGTWQFRNKMHRGGLDAFVSWLDKQ